MMFLKCYTVGSNRSNCYILGCCETNEGMIIDPGFDRYIEAEMILEEIRRSGLNIKYIVNTHGHTDHVAGNGIVKEAIGALIMIHELDAPRLMNVPERWLKRVEFSLVNSPMADIFLCEGDVVKIGKLNFGVMHTPGHSKGSISLVGENIVFTGDTLFEGAIGITDIPGASFEELIPSIGKLIELPDYLTIYPGHGGISTIGEEKRSNPFLRKDLGEAPPERLRKIEELLSNMIVEAVMTPINKGRELCNVDDKVDVIIRQLKDLRNDVVLMAVVDNRMHLLGIIVPSDLIRAKPEEKTIESIMDRNTRAVFLNDRASVAWKTLKNHRFVPVIDNENVLKGFISRKKVMNLLVT